MPDRETSLFADLSALSPRARDSVLAALSPFEREALETLRRQENLKADARISPWLDERLNEARSGNGSMTSVGRRALLRASDTISGNPTGSTGVADPGRSLVGAMGGLLAARRKRP